MWLAVEWGWASFVTFIKHWRKAGPVLSDLVSDSVWVSIRDVQEEPGVSSKSNVYLIPHFLSLKPTLQRTCPETQPDTCAYTTAAAAATEQSL